ncbi:MAG: hypothetical protein U9Q15_03050 [Patescibacteria group bacterium]|nr:hypothetical protein [Patescibacteria group bacterium]
MNIQVNNPVGIHFPHIDISFTDIINILFPLILIAAATAAVVFIIWGALLILSSRGDTEVFERGLHTIRNSITGIIIILIVFLISSFLSNFLGFNFLDFQNLVNFLDDIQMYITKWRLQLT